MDIEINDILIK